MTGYLTSGGVSEGEAISTLLRSIPLNFYCIIAIIFSMLSTFLPLDFGPMKRPNFAQIRQASLTTRIQPSWTKSPPLR